MVAIFSFASSLIASFCLKCTYSQDYIDRKGDYNSYNLIISKTVYNKDEQDSKNIIQLLKKYLSSADSLIPNYSNWTENSIIDYNIPDYMLRSTLYYYNNKNIQSNLIFIERKENYWVAKVAFNEVVNCVNKGLICIYNFGIKKENNLLRLFNILDVADLHKTKIDGCTFFYEQKSKNVDIGISKMMAFNKKMTDIFKTKINFKYIDIQDQKKLNNIIGFDFEQYMNIPTKISALTYLSNNIIYASSNNMYYYPHEIVHLYVYKFFMELTTLGLMKGLLHI